MRKHETGNRRDTYREFTSLKQRSVLLSQDAVDPARRTSLRAVSKKFLGRSSLNDLQLFPLRAKRIARVGRSRVEKQHGGHDMKSNQYLVDREISALRLYSRNARTHSRKQVKQIAASIERFGLTNPVLVSDAGEIVAGHGRVEAAKLLGMKSVPTLALSHLSDAERRAYVIADNKLALNAGWDKEILAIELQALVDLEFDVELTGFSLAEIDFVLDEAGEADPDGVDAAEDLIPEPTGQPVTRMGDLWLLGRHRLLCGDTRSALDMDRLMDGARADLVFTDPPYNVAIDGNVCGLGSVKHREFAFASGEMSQAQFTQS